MDTNGDVSLSDGDQGGVAADTDASLYVCPSYKKLSSLTDFDHSSCSPKKLLAPAFA